MIEPEEIMYKYSELLDSFKNLNCKITENEPMSKHTTFSIGGNADVFITVNDEKSLKEIILKAKENNIPVFILGKGSNILVSDNGIRGIVIKLDGAFSEIKMIDENTIECGAGVSLSRLCSFAQRNALSGLEFAWGIPGSCGGAAYMNAGAYSGEMKDVIVFCRHIDNNGNSETIYKDELNLSYRHSIYSEKEYIITSIAVKLEKDNCEDIKSRMDEYLNRRKTKQPLEFPSAGSVFKRPKGYFAGALIQECNLKGVNVNDACVSEKHSGFIINKGNAKCSDVLELIDHIQNVVKKETGVFLECEVKKVGEFV